MTRRAPTSPGLVAGEGEAPETSPAQATARWLHTRADSYSTDAHALRDLGDIPTACAYEAVRDELRKTADLVTAGGDQKMGATV